MPTQAQTVDALPDLLTVDKIGFRNDRSQAGAGVHDFCSQKIYVEVRMKKAECRHTPIFALAEKQPLCVCT